MGADSKIQWTHHTFNPWWGCVEVSPACDHCYARTFANRLGLKLWGKDTPRRFFGDKHWNEPLKWNRAAERVGEMHRVFCASMADVFEEHDELEPHRTRLWRLIESTPNLVWLLLTKRPGNIVRFLPPALLQEPRVWLGTTVEDQKHGRPRMEVLRRLFVGNIKFVSIEPQIEDLGDVDFRGIDWAIVGGESGHRARPFRATWARKLVAQARRDGAAPFVKQLGAVPMELDSMTGSWPKGIQHTGDGLGSYRMHLKDSHGGDWNEWPLDLRVREFPRAQSQGGSRVDAE